MNIIEGFGTCKTNSIYFMEKTGLDDLVDLIAKALPIKEGGGIAIPYEDGHMLSQIRPGTNVGENTGRWDVFLCRTGSGILDALVSTRLNKRYIFVLI